ncbi:hypothetical protein [Pseudomonas viridiflava]|uniref:hypothetical protein n=1 Tax=Pseudomonas viridiflava TaxID=33069 RepID=UPI001F12EF2A|nr:hypothetical protein [Pseudomonas viridiflava]
MIKLPAGGANSYELPQDVETARSIDWGVPIDAYLMNAAMVGDRFAASVFLDRSGVCANGMTVATPPLRSVMTIRGFEMMKSVCGADYYVIVSRLRDGN